MTKLKLTAIAAAAAVASAAVCIFIYDKLNDKKYSLPLFEEDFFDDLIQCSFAEKETEKDS